MDNQQPNMGANPGPSSAPQVGGFLKQLENFFNTYLHQKAPFHLPPQSKQWIVNYGPWITLVLMLLALPVILAAFSIATFFSPYVMVYGGYHFFYLIGGLIALLALILQGIALPGLFAKKLSGWQMLYYAALVSAVGQLISGNIIAMIVNVIISMYFLFEIREYYK